MNILENKQLVDYRKISFEKTRDYYLIKELDERLRIFQVIKVEYKGNDVRVIDSQLGIHKKDLGEDEKNIFENGRSRSKYLNAVSVYEYYGTRYLNCSYEEFRSVDKSDAYFYEHLHRLTNISTKELSDGKYASYFDKLRDEYHAGTTVLSDQLYENVEGSKMTTNRSVRFFLNVKGLIGLNNIVSASWNYNEGAKIHILKLKTNIGITIILTGFEFGKGRTPDGIGAYGALRYAGFNEKDCELILQYGSGDIIK